MVTARSGTARPNVALRPSSFARPVKNRYLVKSEPVSPSFYFKGSITQQNGKRCFAGEMSRTSRIWNRHTIRNQTWTTMERRMMGMTNDIGFSGKKKGRDWGGGRGVID